MITSEIDICNLALDYCAVRNILSFEEKTKESKICNRWYDIVRKSLLMNLNASFSITRARLVEVADYTPVFGYKKAYVLPHDLLQVLNVGEPLNDTLYQIEKNQYLYCDDNIKEVNIRYIADIKSVVEFDAEFIDLLALKLAEKICMPLTEDPEKTNWIRGLAQQKYIECSTKYGNDNRIVVVNRPRYRLGKMNAEIERANYRLK